MTLTAVLEPTPEFEDPLVAKPADWPEDPEGWQRLADQIIAQARQIKPRVAFLGDSITQGWGGEGLAEWQMRFAALPAANMGIGGDRTQNILWRIAQGTLDGLPLELVVLKIGVNNLWGDVGFWGTQRVAAGIAKVVGAIQTAAPAARVLVLGILPTQSDPANPLRAIVREVNAISAADLPTPDGRVRFADIGDRFIEKDGTISTQIMPDGCHLSPEGYTRFADALEPLVSEMLEKGKS